MKRNLLIVWRYFCVLYFTAIVGGMILFLASQVAVYFRDLWHLDGNNWLEFLVLVAIFISAALIIGFPVTYFLSRADSGINYIDEDL